MARELAWDPVLQVIGTIAEVDEPSNFGLTALTALSSVVPFDVGSFNEIDLESGRAVFVALPEEIEVDQELLDEFPRLVRQNPILQYQEQTGDGSSRRLSDFLSTEALHQLELYQRIYRPHGIEFQVALGLATKHPLVIAFALNRCQSDFSDRELAVLNALRPHLVQAHRNVQALAALQGIDRTLAGAGRAIVVLNLQGRAVHVPAWVRLLLERHFGETPSGELPMQVSTWLKQECQGTLDDGQPRIHQPLVSVIDDQQLVARFVPGIQGRPDAFILEEHSPERGINELRRLRLTSREAELLWFLMKGKTTAEIAKDLGVALGTASKHLQHIYRKLGVLNRTAAIAAASDALFSRW